MTGSRVAVVGAGYSGLAAGYELARHDLPCAVFESAPVAGGLASCFRLGHTWLEKYYHHWFTHDHDVLTLIGELGLDRHLIRRETTTGSFYANRVYRLSSPLDVLRLKPLTMVDRLRLGRMVLRARSIDDYRSLEGRTARQWITDLSSKAVYDVVWRPLFEGKFGRYADRVSAVWFWSKLRTRGESRSRRQREELLYLDGGLHRLTRALCTAITDAGGDLRLNCPVLKVRRTGGAWQVVTRDGSESFDHVVLTTPLPISLDLLDDLPEDCRRRAEAIPYLGVTALVLVMHRRLSPAYWLNVNDPTYPFVGVIEHTNFQSPEAYGGRHIVYLTKYHDESHETCRMDHQALFDAWRKHLERMFPAFEESWVDLSLCWRDPYAQPVVLSGSERHVLPVETPLPGVWMCSMAQVYPQDRGMNYAVRLGRLTGQRVLAAVGVRAVPHRIVRISPASPAPPAQKERAALQPVAALQGLSPA